MYSATKLCAHGNCGLNIVKNNVSISFIEHKQTAYNCFFFSIFFQIFKVTHKASYISCRTDLDVKSLYTLYFSIN